MVTLLPKEAVAQRLVVVPLVNLLSPVKLAVIE
jgi:hypothetical protein